MRRLFFGLTLIGASSIAGAQNAPAIDASCNYARCALTIIPRMSALDVVRGEGEERVGSLAFLYPGRTPSVFAGNDSAFRFARRATGIRYIGAALTDLGGALMLAGAFASARRREHAAPTGVVFAGAAFVGLSVPVHFAADAELSRAVREYNRQFSR